MSFLRDGSSCAGLLLTGGSSRRMGFDKAALVLDGESLAVRAARLLSEVCEPVVEVGPGISGLRAVREDPAGDGPLAALLAGADAVGAAPLLLLAVDLPFVSADLLRRIAGRPGVGSVVPMVGGRGQVVCARYGADAIDEGRVRYSRGERSLSWVVELPSTEQLETESMGQPITEQSFADLDTPDDLDRWGIKPAHPD